MTNINMNDLIKTVEAAFKSGKVLESITLHPLTWNDIILSRGKIEDDIITTYNGLDIIQDITAPLNTIYIK